VCGRRKGKEKKGCEGAGEDERGKDISKKGKRVWWNGMKGVEGLRS
jgi:hypothetical protein